MINGSMWTVGIRVHHRSNRGSVEETYTVLISSEPNTGTCIMPKELEMRVIKTTLQHHAMVPNTISNVRKSMQAFKPGTWLTLTDVKKRAIVPSKTLLFKLKLN